MFQGVVMFLEMLKWLIVLGLGYGIALFVQGYKRQRSRSSSLVPSFKIKVPSKLISSATRWGRFKSARPDMYKRLVTSCVGDKAKAERLIAYEMKRNPSLSRDQAIRSALDRLEYDLKL